MSNRRSFSIQLKLEIVEFALNNSINSASKKYGVARSVIRTWKRNKDKLEVQIGAGSKKKMRLPGTGRKIISHDMEEDLVSWVETNNQQDLHVSRKSIMERARQNLNSYDDTDGKTFKASTGWVHRFMVRNDLSIRRRTTLAQKDPEDLLSKIVSYIIFVGRMRQKYSIEPRNVCAMDETSVFFDMPSNTTVTKKGTKSVGIKTTGYEKTHVTVCLAAYGNGEKLKPFIVFRNGIREITKMKKEDKFKNVELHVQGRGWMDTPLTINWLDTVFENKDSSETRLLAWDSFKCHFMDETVKHFANFNAKMAVIPGGLTKYIQAPDVIWNKPFKAEVMSQYNSWMRNPENMSFTAGGNLRPPPLREIVTWVINAWEKLSTEIIIKSFKSCALSTDPSGSEDHLIHCLKYGERCRGAWDLLQKYRDGDQTVIQQIDGEREAPVQISSAQSHVEQNGDDEIDQLINLDDPYQINAFEESHFMVQNSPEGPSSITNEITMTHDTNSNFALTENEENEDYENLYLYDPLDSDS